MDRATRQLVPAVQRLEAHLLAQQCYVVGAEERNDLGHDRGPPLRPARVVQAPGIVGARGVDAAEHRTHLCALGGRGRREVLALQEAYERSRLAVQLAEKSPALVGHGLGTGYALARQVVLQIEIERQLTRGEPLEQRQDVAAPAGGDEVVRVLDPGRYAFEGHQRSDGIVLEPGTELFAGDGGVDRHAVNGKGGSGNREPPRVRPSHHTARSASVRTGKSPTTAAGSRCHSRRSERICRSRYCPRGSTACRSWA